MSDEGFARADGGAARRARRVFGERAAFYTTSASHTDPQVLARVVELARPEPGWCALDVGTGTGHTAFALAPHVALVVGVDVTPEMLAEAEALRAARGMANVRFSLGDAHALPFADERFDLVTCRRAAHHLADVRAALREMRRVLRPGGRLVVDDRSVPEDDALDALMNRLDRLHDASHVRQWRPSEWLELAAGAGFDVEVVEPYVRHRPLTSLTEGVGEDGVREIRRLLSGLDEAQRAALALEEKGGEPYLNHWYVMLAARKVPD